MTSSLPQSIKQTGAKSKRHIPILAYHQVVGGPSEVKNTPWGMVRDFTLLPDFERQMSYLHERGFTTVTPEEFVQAQRGRLGLPDRSVMLTFDDGRLNVLENAFPIMQRYGLKGTAYVVSALADGDHTVEGHTLEAESMRWEQLEVLRAAGWLIGSHTKNHSGLHLLSEREIISELTESRAAIEHHVQAPCRHFAYPGGYKSDVAERLVAAEYETARLWMIRGRYEYPNLDTSPFRLNAMNISYHFPFSDFVRLVERQKPAHDYQWNRLRVELSRGQFTRGTLRDLATMPRSVLEHFGIRPPHMSVVAAWIRDRVSGSRDP